MPTDAERDPVEWAQHTALVAISVARTVLDLLEGAVADRERIERLATTGRSAAETWLTDMVRVASTVATGFGFEPEKPPAKPSAAPRPHPVAQSGPPPTSKPASRKTAVRGRPAATKARSMAAKKAAKTPAKPRKAASPRPKKRKK